MVKVAVAPVVQVGAEVAVGVEVPVGVRGPVRSSNVFLQTVRVV